MLNQLKSKKRSFKKRLIAIVALSVVWFLLMLLADYPSVVERYYSDSSYPFLCHLLHPVFNIFSFSVGDLVYIAVIIYLVYAFCRFINMVAKKQFKQAGIFILGLLLGVQSGVIIFYIFWGMNYFRPSAGQRLNLRDTSYTTANLKVVAAMLIDSANATRKRVTPADLAQDNAVIYKNAIKAITKLSNDSIAFRSYKPDIKPSLLTPLLNYIGTSGYYNPFTGEAQINYEMPIFDRPVVACHEMSHQVGFGAEDEADFAGFLAGIGSSDRLLRYSAYHLAVDEFMHALYYRDSLTNKALKPRISAAVHNDFKIERQYWVAYQTRLEIVTSVFYDHFLKANNQPQGVGTYNRMVLLVMAKYMRKGSR